MSSSIDCGCTYPHSSISTLQEKLKEYMKTNVQMTSLHFIGMETQLNLFTLAIL